MKKAYLFLIISLLSVRLNAQQTISSGILHNGINRQFILYVPLIYNGSKKVPLLLNFHGRTLNATHQMAYGDFRSIADTAGFIIVHPEGLLDNTAQSHFNVGWDFGMGVSSTNDLGFTAALIDTLIKRYSIDTTRIYSTGFSNGGFMSFHLACYLSGRIAAIGSVAGSMVPATRLLCQASHPTPVIQIHGTSDTSIPYSASSVWSDSVTQVLKYWAGFNNCNPNPLITNMPDISSLDVSTVQKTEYVNGDKCAQVVHYKIINGSHSWPGSSQFKPGTNYDINASLVIWDFFSKYNLNGLINCNALDVKEEKLVKSYRIYPNPAREEIRVDGNFNEAQIFHLFSILGTEIKTGYLKYNHNSIDLSDIESGMYLLQISTNKIPFFKR